MCVEICSPEKSSCVTALSYPPRYKHSAAWKSNQANNKTFFEVSPIRKTTAVQFMWLTALVLSKGN
jgi:hypothetical protein